MKLQILVLALLAVHHAEGARILGVFPYPSRSHSILGQALFTELAKRGHDVTYVSPYPFKTPPAKNYRDVGITSQDLIKVFEAEIDASFEEVNENIIKLMKMWFDNVAAMQEYFLSDPAVQKLLDSNEKFDVCIIEILMNESSLGFGPHFGCKVIVMSTFGQVKYINDMIHSPAPFSTTPHPFLSLTDRMNFWERAENIVTNLIEDVGFWVYHYPLQASIYDKYFKAEKPSFAHAMRHSVSLVLLNTHFSLNFPQAYLPNMIEIGGFHVKNETKPLPEDIKTFIENAEQGVVYFSLGGNLKPSKMKPEKQRDILAALSKLKQKIIWKRDDENLTVDESKFLVRKWLPQDDILAHPNVKLFVTHGGLLSCTESILRGKPIVGIPIFGDQMMNMARAEILGWGAQVPYHDLNEALLTEAFNKVLTDSTYTENVKEVAKRLRDQPETPMDKAIYWIEYVERNNGAHYMQASAQHLSFIEYHNLDVYASFAFVVFLVIFIPIFIFKKVANFVCSCMSKSASPKKKTN